MGRTLINLLILFFLLIFAQVIIFNNICLFNIAIPIVFIYFIIRLPITININWALTIAFFTGLIVDIFSNTQGMHALSCTIITFARRDILRLYISREEDITDGIVSIKSIGMSSFLKYTFTIILLYSLVIFCIEAFTFFNPLLLMSKIITSTFLSFVIILGIDRIANNQREKRL